MSNDRKNNNFTEEKAGRHNSTLQPGTIPGDDVDDVMPN